MKIPVLSVLAIFFSIFLTATIQGQSPDKSTQQIVDEYKKWSEMRDDWANLSRYKSDNEKLKSSEDENRIVFMGNSITEGWGDLYPEFFEGKPYVNRGIGGQTTPQMLIRFRPDVIDLTPKAVFILAGTNDIAGNTGPSSLKMIQDNIYSMAELARVSGIRVFLSSILPVYDYPWRPGLQPAEKIIEMNKNIKEFADKNNMIYVDLFTPMADERNGMKAEYSDDEVHPNREGYKIMSDLTEAAIEAALTAER